MLIVSMGFGVVLPYLGAIQKKARHFPATCATTCLRGLSSCNTVNCHEGSLQLSLADLCRRLPQIIALGVTYFVAVSALDIISNVGTIDDLTSAARIILVLPVAALDAIFILWVFTSLSRTLNQLQARRATAKLDLYRSAPPRSYLRPRD